MSSLKRLSVSAMVALLHVEEHMGIGGCKTGW